MVGVPLRMTTSQAEMEPIFHSCLTAAICGLPAGILSLFHTTSVYRNGPQRLQRCFVYRQEDRRNRRDRRALRYYNIHYHIGKRDFPSLMFRFVLIANVIFVHQSARIYIQMLGQCVRCHTIIDLFRQFARTAYPFPIIC